MENPWKWIEDYFVNDGRLCAECKWCHRWNENHGPGLQKPLAECLVLANLAPNDCPAWAHHIEKELK